MSDTNSATDDEEMTVDVSDVVEFLDEVVEDYEAQITKIRRFKRELTT